MGEVKKLQDEIVGKYPELKELTLSGKKDQSISIHSIRVKPEHYGEGIGTKVLTDIKRFAKENNVPIILSPEADRGKKKALQNFYQKNGFQRCKDPQLTSVFGPTLIWYPQS
jgi:GNAT superfamily N-acetyltransferase